MTDENKAEVSAVFSTVASELPTSEAGMFQRVGDGREVRGLLAPFNELSKPNQSGNEPVMFSRGTIKVPRDVSVMTLNVGHSQFAPIGRVTAIEETDAGIVATFSIADTDEGDAFLANPLRKLSAEYARIVRDSTDRTRAVFGAMTGAAVVPQGAFESAALFAAVEDETPVEPAEAEELSPEERLEVLAQRVQDLIDQLNLKTPEEPAEEPETSAFASDATPAQDTPTTKESNVDETTNAGAQVPATLLASAPGKAADVDMNAVYSAMSAVKSSRGGQTADQETFLAALADITTPAHVTSGAIQPTFTGKLWQGKRYQQRYISLANHQIGGIALGGRKGWKIDQGTALVAEVANAAQKVELPTGTATTSLYGSTLRKYGFAADVALEWQYLEGGNDVLAAFWEGVVDSAAKVMDEAALKDIFTLASRGSGAALSRLVAPGTYPAVAGHDYPVAMGQLIQGVEAVSDNNDDASFAIVNPTAWNQLLFTPKDLVPEFVEFSVGIGTGEASTGKVKVVKAPQSFFTGTDATKPQTIVGAKNAIEFREVHADINALEVAKFGVDRAMVSFLETFVVREESLVIVGTKP